MTKGEERKGNRLKKRDPWDTSEQAGTYTVGVLEGERGRRV